MNIFISHGRFDPIQRTGLIYVHFSRIFTVNQCFKCIDWGLQHKRTKSTTMYYSW